MSPTRKQALTAVSGAAALASIGVLRFPASAAEFDFKLGNDQTETHPMTVESVAAAKRVLEATGGRLDIRVFPASALGGDPQMLAQARSGALELLQIGNNVAANVVPVAALESIPFAFASYKQLMGAADGALGAHIGAALGKVGLRAFARTFYGGAFQIETRSAAVETPEDLKGVKIRVPPGPIDVATFKAFGASPAVLSLVDVYSSLQTHLVDAIEVPLPTIENFKFYEQIKFCALTRHANLIYVMVANPDAWAKLPKTLQEIVDREFAVAAQRASAAMLASEESIESSLRARGIVFNRPAPEPFRRAIREAGLYPKWRDAYGAEGWGLLEKAVGKLL